jgi:hypothetical protein
MFASLATGTFWLHNFDDADETLFEMYTKEVESNGRLLAMVTVGRYELFDWQHCPDDIFSMV